MKNMKIIIVALALSATGTAALPITAAANAEEVAARPPAYATGAELAAALDADLRASAALSGPRSAAGSAPIPVWTPEIMALFKEMNLPLPPDAMTGFPVKQDAPLKQLGRRLTDRGEGYGYGGEGYGYGDYGLITATCAATEYVLDNECEACPSGFTCDGAVATVCDSIKYVLNNKCEDCPDGSTCDGAKATKCAAGIVKDNACEDCPDGHTCDGTKATKCAAPKYVKDNACVWPKLATAAERAECLAGSDGSCDKCCQGITGVCKHITQSGPGVNLVQKRIDRNESSLTDEDDFVLLEANYNNISATSPRLKRPWLFFASARRVGRRRRRRDRRQGPLQPPHRQRLPRPSGIPFSRRLVPRAAGRSRRRFARA